VCAEDAGAPLAAALLHGALCAVAAAAAEDAHAALPVETMRDVAAAAAAALRRGAFARYRGAPHARLVLLLACAGCRRRDSSHAAADDDASDAERDRALSRLSEEADAVMDALLYLLRDAAPEEVTSVKCLRPHGPPPRLGRDTVPVGATERPRLRRWWRFAALEAHVDAAAALLPEQCAAQPHRPCVRDGLNALLATQSRRFRRSLTSLDDDVGGSVSPAQRRPRSARLGEAYTRGLACGLRADAAIGGGRLGVDAAALRATLDATRALLQPHAPDE
jgi:hypothetical protein